MELDEKEGVVDCVKDGRKIQYNNREPFLLVVNKSLVPLIKPFLWSIVGEVRAIRGQEGCYQ